MGNNLSEMHIVRNSHNPSHPMPQALWVAHAQYTTSLSPERSHHDIATAMTMNNSILFRISRLYQLAQSAWEHMKPTLIAPFATCCPFGIPQPPPTVHATNKDTCLTRVDEFFAEISNIPANVQVVVTSTMELKNTSFISMLPACLLSRILMPYNADDWQNMLLHFRLFHKYPALIEQLMHSFHV